jgi:Ca2+-binding EF-hand superfamily protein
MNDQEISQVNAILEEYRKAV